jgi:hypothetical protein
MAMDGNGKVFGRALVGVLALTALMALVAVAGVTRGLVTLEAWRTGLAAMPVIAPPMPVLAALDMDEGAAAPPQPSPAPAGPSSGPGRTGTVGRTGACVFGGMVGTGAAMVAGPAELASLVAGLFLVPVSGPWVAAILGGGFVTGCAVTATVATMVR